MVAEEAKALERVVVALVTAAGMAVAREAATVKGL